MWGNDGDCADWWTDLRCGGVVPLRKWLVGGIKKSVDRKDQRKYFQVVTGTYISRSFGCT